MSGRLGLQDLGRRAAGADARRHRREPRDGLPPLVERAVGLARRLGFASSCRPEHGRLLHALAAGAGTIGETGTGCGVGLAWLAGGARPGTQLVSAEIDTERAGLVATRRFPH